ncbi:MAG: thioesterase family protein [Bacillota bacterium]|jgi:fluoroacetyl-CoA thioesterase|nr:thioesterase family protein [Candidatus Fermentithermobacillaceae bacterium]
MKPLQTGIHGKATVRVTDANVASSVGSGAVDVFSTPSMVLLMEEAAVDALRPYIEEGESTVGSAVNVRHISPTPIGLEVTATATLTEIDGRRLVFQVEAHDGVATIGEGTHERFLIAIERFISRAREKSTRRNTSSVE